MFIRETYSTNSLLKAFIAEEFTTASELLHEPLPYLRTDYQTAGRGQVGNTWESERGKNILMSVLLREPAIAVEQQFVLSEVFPLAVVEGVEQVTGAIGLTIKWPNDIYAGDKKLAGILIENTLAEGKIAWSILGLGLNVNQTVWQGSAPNPVSLRVLTGREWDVDELTQAILQRLKERMETIDPAALRRDYEARLYRREGWHRYRDEQGELEARIADIDDYGRLVLELRSGEKRTYHFKEVAYIL